MKTSEIKKKVAAKVAKGKRKVAKKCGRGKAKCASVAFALCALLSLCGCQNPAQRSITITTDIYAYGSSRINLGGQGDIGSAAQSNETGGNDAGLVASPTTDVKPEVAVGVGGSSVGTGKGGASSQSGTFSRIGAGVDAAASLLSSGDAGDADKPATAATDAAVCTGDECSEKIQ